MEAPATSRAFRRGRPPCRRAESVRVSWLVAYIFIRRPMYGTERRRRSITMAEFSWRAQALNATQPPTRTRITQKALCRRNTAKAITMRVRRGSSTSIPP
jgi:hypothetical protein